MSTAPAVVPPATSSSRTDEIRVIASDLFRSRGYTGTTMADIAGAAGVLPGSLYHHFESKEVIAVELLHALEVDLAKVASRLIADDEHLPPEERLRHLVTEVMGASYRHAAAVRLHAYEPPTIATGRLRDALHLRAKALDALWRSAIDELSAMAGSSSSDARLLRFALQNLSLNACIDYPAESDYEQLALHLCDLLLHGIAMSIDERELDASTALAAARAEVASWGPGPGAPAAQSTVRDKIVTAARLEFSRRGYDATTVRDIATTADVTMGTLYRNADSKVGLITEVMNSYEGHFERAVRNVLSAGASEAASLDGLAWVFVHAARRFGEESNIVKVGWLDRDSPSNPFHGYYLGTDARLGLLRETLERGVRNGSLRPLGGAVDVAPHIRFTMWLPYQDQGRTSAQRAHDFLRRTMLRGFLTTASEARVVHHN
jgi:AcrR family transcriptional regulator